MEMARVAWGRGHHPTTVFALVGIGTHCASRNLPCRRSRATTAALEHRIRYGATRVRGDRRVHDEGSSGVIGNYGTMSMSPCRYPLLSCVRVRADESEQLSGLVC